MARVSRYFLVSLPLQGLPASTMWSSLQHGISAVAFDTPTYKFQIPQLRVETLNTLLTLGDDLTKVGGYVEGVSIKLRKQIEEMELTTSSVSSSLFVDGIPVEIYVTRFSWNSARYPLVTPLKDTTSMLQQSVARLEDDLRVRVANYTTVETQLSAIARKNSGSLAVRDLTTLVRTEDVVSTEHMTTLPVVISKHSQQDWILHYETLSQFVVPRSTKKLQEDADYTLYTVLVFRHDVESFRSAARAKGFQVRDLTLDPPGEHHLQEEVEHLQQENDKRRHSLLHWCYGSFGEVFSAWMHLCAIRIFVESILRYGLPPTFLAVLLAPTSVKNERKVRRVLDELCGNTGSGTFWIAEDDPLMIGLVGDNTEVHPYVSFPINISS